MNRQSILTDDAALAFQRKFNLRENQMRTSPHKEIIDRFRWAGHSSLHPNSAPLALKHTIHPEEIRDNLPAGQGGIGFLFHATDWDTLSFSFHNVKRQKRVIRRRALENKAFYCIAYLFGIPGHRGQYCVSGSSRVVAREPARHQAISGDAIFSGA